MKILKVLLGVLSIPAICLVFAECKDFSMVWVQFLAGGYLLLLAVFSSREEVNNDR